jgi:hypothetical protein
MVSEMNVRDAVGDYSHAIDFGDLISPVCLACGGDLLRIVVTFDNQEIAAYFTDAECIQCGSRFKCPTPIDTLPDL